MNDADDANGKAAKEAPARPRSTYRPPRGPCGRQARARASTGSREPAARLCRRSGARPGPRYSPPPGRLMSSRYSIRVFGSLRKAPSMALVMMTASRFRTPRIAMQRCTASIVTATP